MARSGWPYHRWHCLGRAGAKGQRAHVRDLSDLSIRRGRRFLRGVAGRDLSTPENQSPFLPSGSPNLGSIRSPKPRQFHRSFRALDRTKAVSWTHVGADALVRPAEQSSTMDAIMRIFFLLLLMTSALFSLGRSQSPKQPFVITISPESQT